MPTILKRDRRFTDRLVAFVKQCSDLRAEQYIGWWEMRDERIGSALKTIRALHGSPRRK